MPAWGVCNLGHFVLPRFYDEKKNDVNWKELRRAIPIAVRLQDNIIDYTDYYLEENEKQQKSERRVGIGTMGLGTLLIRLGLRYGSHEADEFINELYKFIAVETYKASIDIAEEKGAFPMFEAEKMVESGFMKRLFPELPKSYQKKFMKTGIRNVTLLTQAPTGSTGTYIDNIPAFRENFGGTTTGIEPYFSWSYWRASRLGVVEQNVPLVQKHMDENGIEKIDNLPKQFVTAMEMTPMEHVKVQATIQKWTDSSISKTANAPSDFTVEDTGNLYLEGYKLGLKGVTIYRDSSRDTQVLATTEEGAKLSEDQSAVKKAVKEVVDEFENKKDEDDYDIKRVPSRLYGVREKIKYQSGNSISKAYIHIYVDEESNPVEVWINPTDPTDKEMSDALGRMITQFLRFGITNNNVEQTIKHLKTGKTMMSLPYKVGKILSDVYYGKTEMPNMKKDSKIEIKENSTKINNEEITFNQDVIKKENIPSKRKLAKCDECGADSYDKANCLCYSCGFSSCN